MKKHSLFILSSITISLFALSIHVSTAFAAEVGYFSGRSTTNFSWCDMLSSSCGGLDANLQNYDTIPTFENHIINLLNNGSTQQKISAAFIIESMIGQGSGAGDYPAGITVAQNDIAEWKSRLSNPAITIRAENYSFSVNTAYTPELRDIVRYSDSASQLSLVFYINGTSGYAIKADCGNPVGIIPLPKFNPDWSLSGKTTTNVANVYPGDKVTFTSSITNDNQGGTANFAYGPRYFYSDTSTPSGGMGDPYSGETGSNVAGGGTLAPGDSITGIDDAVTVSVGTTRKYICGTVAFSPYNSKGDTAGRSKAKCVSISQPNPTCIINAPANVAVGQNFSITYGASYQGAAAADAVWDAGGRAFYEFNPGSKSGIGGSLSGSKITGTSNITGLTSGVYTLKGGVKNSGIAAGNDSCTTTVTVGYIPYFSVLGGDIAAGPGFCGLTNPNGNADILGSNTDNDPAGTNYFGAGSQYAALALRTIKSFATGQASGTTSSFGGTYDTGNNAPWRLAIANNSSSAATLPTYGGKYYSTPAIGSASGMCVPDYVGTVDSSLPPPNLSATGVYTLSGGQSISGSIPNKTFVTVKVNGDVYINGPIVYSGAGAYGSIDQIPRFALLVKGNIYIDKSVTRLDGFYVAEGNGSNTGRILTCASNHFTYLTGDNSDTRPNAEQDANAYNDCNAPLTINGAVAAAKIIAGRTAGNVVNAPGVLGIPAEAFQFSPELWLSCLDISTNCNGGPGGGGGGLSTGRWQAITSLPPIL